MGSTPRNRFAPLWALGALLLLLLVAAVAAVSAGQATASPAVKSSKSNSIEPCIRLEDFDRHDFPRRPSVDNRYLPLRPGTQLTLEGDVDGEPHRVVFTVTDLMKKVGGVNALVIWDIDESDGELVESELSFFAQDEDDNVWNVGEYPEEFENGEFVGAPSTWITGEADAEAGIHMAGRTRVSSRLYVQGFAPEIDFLDCARVVAKYQSVCVPAGCSDQVLITNEQNILDPEGGIQSKFHVPGVGIVKIGVVEPATGESLELTDFKRLDRDELREARKEALRLDRRGFRFSEVYRATEPAERF
jgi:hypothetical protein